MSSDSNSHISLVAIAEQAMLDYGFIPHPSAEAVGEAERAAQQPAHDDGRRDLTALPWSSIDNVESQDLDQIEVAEELPDGSVKLLVGIADVDAFVAKGGAVDDYAGNNTTSVYTGPRIFPMLPDVLSFHASSLLPGQRRAAVVLEVVVDADGNVGPADFYPAVVINHAKLDYPSVSAWLDQRGPMPQQLGDPKLRAQVELHDRLAQRLGKARKAAGSIDVDTGEVRAVVDAHGQVAKLEAHHQDRAGKIIEELMIACNHGVAQKLDALGLPSLRRVVKQPERWLKLSAFAAEHGEKLPPEPSSKALARFVDRMRASMDAEAFGELSLAVVKLMGRGEYVAHAPHEPEIGHFGLATMEYAHSTAPNRRYPDLVTQRMIKAHAAGKPAPYSRDGLQAIAARCTEMEAQADKVARRVQKSAAAELLARQVGHVYEGIITGAGDKGTFVRTFEPVAEGKVVRNGHGLQVGQHVRVKLLDVSVARGFIDFERVTG